MNVQKIIILSMVLCFLIFVFYLMESPLTNRHEAANLFIPGFAKQKAASFYIQSPDKGVFFLKRQKGGWVVTKDEKSYPADITPINKLMDTVATITIETIASKNPAKQELFEVDQQKGIEVKIEDASQNTLAHFYVGKSGPDLFSTYIRKQASSLVILTNGILKTVFDKDLKDWRDKTIFQLQQNEIIAYQVKGARKFQLQKGDNGQWEMTKPAIFPAKRETVTACITTLASLTGSDFAEGPLKNFQLEKPLWEITATLVNGQTKTLFVGKEKNAFQHFVKTGDAATIYVLENYKLESLTPDVEKFKKEDQEKEQTKQAPDPPAEKNR